MVFKVGILGCGNSGVQHAQAYRACRGVEVVACADSSLDRAMAFRKKNSVLRAYDDYSELLDNERLDAVSICAPEALHAELAIRALEAGFHVLCERPMALNSAEGELVIEAARESAAILSIVHHHRYVPAVRYLKERIGHGMLGEIRFVRSHAIRRCGTDGWGEFHIKNRTSHGVLLDLGADTLDLCLWLMGSPFPISATGSITTIGRGENVDELWPDSAEPAPAAGEEYACGFVKFANGASLSLEASWGAHVGEPEDYTQLLVGERGSAVVNPFGRKLPALRIAAAESDLLLDTVPEGFAKVNTRMAQIRDWVACLYEGRRPLVDPQECLNTLRVIDALRLSAGRRCEIYIEESLEEEAL